MVSTATRHLSSASSRVTLLILGLAYLLILRLAGLLILRLACLLILRLACLLILRLACLLMLRLACLLILRLACLSRELSVLDSRLTKWLGSLPINLGILDIRLIRINERMTSLSRR